MKVFVIAGESSGDALGSALMAGLKNLVPDIGFQGVGGPLMFEQGLSSLFPMEDLSVMGLAEVLPRYGLLKRRIRETAHAIAQARPDVVITIDSPGFCLRVLRLARAAHPTLRTVHYVAPSVWAWRPGRAQKMAPLVDQVLALLPFEPPLMEAARMRCDFVGHPIVAQPVPGDDEAQAFRLTHGIAPTTPLALVLPGSRKGEVSRLGPIFTRTMAQVRAAVPGLRVVVPTVAARADEIRALCADWPEPPLILDAASTPPEVKRAAFKAADVALAASGTVSLELAAAGTPMVIGYRLNPVSELLIKRLLKVKTVTLVNLVSELDVVPEYLSSDCTAENLAPALIDLFTTPEARAKQRAAMDLTMERLGRGGEAPGLRAARAVLDGIRAAQSVGKEL